MLTRRRFFTHLAGMGGALLDLPVQAAFAKLPTLIRSRPNPDDGHQTLADAEVLCILCEQHKTLDEHYLELENCSKATIAALKLLAQKEYWIFGNFGFAGMSVANAIDLACSEICWPSHYDAEDLPVLAIATLAAAWNESKIRNVTVLDAPGFEKLIRIDGFDQPVDVYSKARLWSGALQPWGRMLNTVSPMKNGKTALGQIWEKFHTPRTTSPASVTMLDDKSSAIPDSRSASRNPAS